MRQVGKMEIRGGAMINGLRKYVEVAEIKDVDLYLTSCILYATFGECEITPFGRIKLDDGTTKGFVDNFIEKRGGDYNGR